MLLAILAAPNRAHAGLVFPNSDVFQLTPFVGAEVTRFGFAGLDSTGLKSGDYVASGITYGALGGFKLGPVSVGVLFQRTEELDTPQNLSLNLNKLYGEIGMNVKAGKMIAVMHLDFGWAFFQPGNAKTEEGFGGKLGLALDFYPIKWLSLGGGVDLDIQGFDTERGLIGGFGGTFVFRVGLHI